jgi:hypothetical protein
MIACSRSAIRQADRATIEQNVNLHVAALVVFSGFATVAHAQNEAACLEATIGSAGAHISVPLGLLRHAVDSPSCLVSWDRRDDPRQVGSMGVIVKVSRPGADRRAHAVSFQLISVGSAHAVEELQDTGVRARVEGSRVLIVLGPSTALNTLQGWRPDSLRVESPPWGFAFANHAWIYPKYRL